MSRSSAAESSAHPHSTVTHRLLFHIDGHVDFDNVPAALIAGSNELFRFAISEKDRIRVLKVAKNRLGDCVCAASKCSLFIQRGAVLDRKNDIEPAVRSGFHGAVD